MSDHFFSHDEWTEFLAIMNEETGTHERWDDGIVAGGNFDTLTTNIALDRIQEGHLEKGPLPHCPRHPEWRARAKERRSPSMTAFSTIYI